MNVRPSILCPIDFSDGIGERTPACRGDCPPFRHQVDPADRGRSAADGKPPISAPPCRWGVQSSASERWAYFAAKTLGPDAPALPTLEYDVAVGKPAPGDSAGRPRAFPAISS